MGAEKHRLGNVEEGRGKKCWERGQLEAMRNGIMEKISKEEGGEKKNAGKNGDRGVILGKMVAGRTERRDAEKD